jgi:hypothetical protein
MRHPFSNNPDTFRYTHFPPLMRRTISLRISWALQYVVDRAQSIRENEEMLMNTSLSLSPQTSFEGPTLPFDFPGLHIGIAEYAEGPTSCTVFYFPDGVATAIDARGGLVVKCDDYERNHAICGCVARKKLIWYSGKKREQEVRHG